MAKWLFKSEPDTWSWQDQCAKGDGGEPWDGVRNYQARNFMRQMQIGDQGFFYHSQKTKEIVGVVEVIAMAHQDPRTQDERWQCVDIKALFPFENPVTLAQVKADPILSQMILAKNPRLSVQPVTEEEWQILLNMGGVQ